MGHVPRCSGYELVRADMVQARDCYLYDVRGKRYVDFEAGVWCAALGHGHRRVNQAIRRQVEHVIHIGYRYTIALATTQALA